MLLWKVYPAQVRHAFEPGDLAANITRAVEEKQTIVDHLSEQVMQAATELQQYFAGMKQQFVAN